MTLTSIHQESDLRWAKYNDIRNASFIYDNILLIGSENSLTFINLNDGTSILRRITGNIGDGVSCVAGHNLYEIFAFAEACTNPKIHLYSYPGLKLISTFQRDNVVNYLSLTFSETEHLIAITGLPKYELEIWNWRTGKLLVVEPTNIQVNSQILRVSHSFPLTITQYNTETGNINFWEVYLSVDIAKLIKRKIKCPFEDVSNPYRMCYGIDGCIFFMNKMCSVYQIYPASNKCNEIIPSPSDNVDFNTHIKLYKGGLVISGCDGYLRFYKKISKEWMEQWKISLQSSITALYCYNMEYLVAGFTNRNLTKLIDDSDAGAGAGQTPTFQLVADFDMAIKYFAIINPSGNYVATVNSINELCIVEIKVDKKIAKINLKNISSMVGHPKLPIILYGNTNGYVYSLSIYEPQNPSYLSKLYLTTHSIDSIKYSSSGRMFVACTSDNSIFVLQQQIGQDIRVFYHMTSPVKLLYCTIIDKYIEVDMTALTLPLNESQNRIASNQLLQFSITEADCKRSEITLDNEYTSIEYLNDEMDKLIAVPFNRKDFEIITLMNQKTSISATSTMKTPHLLKYFQIQVYPTFFITFGLDGFVNVWDSKTFELISTLSPHNKFFGGVHKCSFDAFRRYFITLGNSNNLMCTELSTNFHSKSSESLNNDIGMYKWKKFISVDTLTESAEKTWIQLKMEGELEKERLTFQEERDAILTDLESIKEKLAKIIDENENGPENTKLNINEFNLNADETKKLLEESQRERLEKEEFLIKFCSSQNKITELILSKTWNSIDVKGTALRGVFTKLKVENYALIKSDEHLKNDLQRVILWRRAERLLSQGDMFEPWIPKTTTELEIGLSKLPGCVADDDDVTASNEDNARVNQCENSNYITALSGTSSHLYIKPISFRYNQIEVVTYQQMVAETIMGFHDTLALRKYFNQIFDKMMKTKEYEIGLVKERNERLRHIQREKNVLEKLKNSTIVHYKEIIDPEYKYDEIPNSIIKVDETEIGVTPYITADEQKLLDKEREEVQTRYRELMADDFPDRALNIMMNGVLEQKWEDEIKKDPAKPECLATLKDPRNYTAADLASISQYEKQVKNIRDERDKYFNMLNDEEDMIVELLEKQVKSFNSKIGETFLQKLSVEFSIGCEELKLLRYHLLNFNRQQLSIKENDLFHEMQELKNEIEALSKTYTMLDEIFIGCRAKYEELNERNRLFDKQFKSNFLLSAPSQAVVDQAYRVFRRRPKWQMRAWQTAAILQDMAKRISTGDSTTAGLPPLPEVCFAHLELLEKVDKFSNAPNLMDQNNWPVLCKMRREKIEIEFKVKSCGALLADAEASASAFAKEINLKKQILGQFDNKLDELREEQKSNLMNRSMQICLKGGAIEVPLTGCMKDFDEVILLHESDVCEVNEIIRKAGNMKLKVMECAAVFRRKIIHKEWQHKTWKIKIRNKKDAIKCIEKCKITKEVQNWLQYKKFGKGENISKSDLEREKEAVYAQFEIGCRETTKQIERTEKKILEKKLEMSMLDKRIQAVNLNVAELNLKRNVENEETTEKEKKDRLELLFERSRLVKKVQKQHARILELTTMLELQRLKTYPTLNLQS